MLRVAKVHVCYGLPEPEVSPAVSEVQPIS